MYKDKDPRADLFAASTKPPATGLIAVSVTRCAALMLKRAARAKIQLGDFLDA